MNPPAWTSQHYPAQIEIGGVKFRVDGYDPETKTFSILKGGVQVPLTRVENYSNEPLRTHPYGGNKS